MSPASQEGDPLTGAIHLRPTRGLPLHRQLAAALRSLIRSGQAPPGAPLPGEVALAAQLGVSRHTVRHALSALAAEGLLLRPRGRGRTARVAPPGPPIERRLGSFYAFAWESRARGAAHRSLVLARSRLPADGQLADRLALPPGSPVERIQRLRTADGEPLELETAYLPRALTAQLGQDTLEQEALYDFLERAHGLVVTGAHETIRPTLLDRRAAGLLGVRPRAPAFSVERLTSSDRGPVEWHLSLVRGDRYLYSVELPRRPARWEPPAR